MMLSTNVLCMKKRKKKTYSLSTKGKDKGRGDCLEKASRSDGSTVTMLQITEDTPPDMLAGAMDLTVHLPTGRAVKMSVERSTPMMDLLVQITTNHHLQLSNYTLQALGMAPSSELSDKLLPYKPNTPIGTLDTQHIKVIPKSRTLPVPKNLPPGHQPFESTFRLKVHLPRNQLYVTRVSRNVLLEDIMKKVCEEKNLDAAKYEFKHPGNLDETLDPKLTLSDYQITEIYVVSKGTVSVNQVFSSSDIMALRKEEERKQMHTKTGGGVFNLIFRRGKSSMGSGSISSDTRSISPTHSDDSRSVTPPGVQPQILTPPKKEPPAERPKPPIRKRRPAPKPPQRPEDTRIHFEETERNVEDSRRNSQNSRRNSEQSRRNSEEKPASAVSEVNELQSRRMENGLVICHSRNSSDSSGYHEASVLSEHCNTSLPRRPKSAFVGSGDVEKLSVEHSLSNSNLSKMSSHSKSTTSLGMAGRKKKAAPLPPPVVRASNSAINLDTPNTVVASPSIITQAAPCTSQETPTALSIPVPLPRTKSRAPPVPRPRIEFTTSKAAQDLSKDFEGSDISIVEDRTFTKVQVVGKIDNSSIIAEVIREVIAPDESRFEEKTHDSEIHVTRDRVGVENLEKDIPLTHEIGEKIKDSNNNDSFLAPSEAEELVSVRSAEQDISDEVTSNAFVVEQSEEESNQERNKVEDGIQITKNTSQIDLEPSELNNGIPTNHEDDKTIDSSENLPVIISDIQKSLTETIFTSSEFLGDKKLPEVVAVIPKSTPDIKASPFDTFGKKRLQTSNFFSFEEDKRRKISKGSVASALETFNFIDDFSDLDESVFSGSISSAKNFSLRDDVYNQLCGIHGLDDNNMVKTQSVSSLRSLRSVNEFFNNNSLKRWDNTKDLDDSLTSLGPYSRSVVGDISDSESPTSHQAFDSLASITSCPGNISPNVNEDANLTFGSTDSGIAQEVPEKETEDFRTVTPPPPPLFLDEPTVSSEVPLVETQPKFTKEVAPVTEASKEVTVDAVPLKEDTIESSKIGEERLRTAEEKNDEISEIDWQYQLPSPPKAFRDSSPVNLPEEAPSDFQSVTDFKDSVVTSPELFEKLRNIEDSQSEKETITSDLTSVISEEDRPPLMNTLSLENLERRKSLVYNRELSTSLKMNDEVNFEDTETFSSSLTKFEDTFMEVQNSSQHKRVHEPKIIQKTTVVSSQTHTLPNFKISTYDHPKQKIKVFEDDTIRSNTEEMNRINVEASTLSRNQVGRSMEDISVRKSSFDAHSSHSAEEKEYTFFKSENNFTRSFGPVSSVFRSESFSQDNWSPPKPVSRSKSHVTLDANKYRIERRESGNDGMSKSNSLYDVSGLQSIGVMRLIQNTLNTPTSSMENIQKVQDIQQKTLAKPEPQNESPQNPPLPETIEKPTVQGKTYKYRGPPSINMGTWSERPKVPVSVKEDADYTLGNVQTSKLIVNTTNNNITSNNSIEIKSSNVSGGNGQKKTSNSLDTNGLNGLSIKVNGTELSEPSNVVIKIGNVNPQAAKTLDNHRFISHTTAVGYRKPFSTLNKNQRPHSVAFDSDFDISRVPVVRSVELKKPFKDMENTSITQLNKVEPVSELRNKFSSMYRSTESLSTKTYLNQCNGVDDERDAKPVSRVASFKPGPAPVVRGFRTNNGVDWANRLSWNPPGNFNTLPSKSRERDNYVTNTQVPFSQSNLRRTDSKILEKNSMNSNLVNVKTEKDLLAITKSDIVKAPPPPPQMPKVALKKPVVKPVEPIMDQRDQLLHAIRNFGGKKGLRAVRD